MGRQANETKPIKHICAGLLAHVDAGKTTLVRGNALSDRRSAQVGTGGPSATPFWITLLWSAARGITIFSKQAVFSLGDMEVTLLDTPGHVDFSAEMERTLQVLDAAVLVVSGTDGVQGHTETLWRLLRRASHPRHLFLSIRWTCPARTGREF